MTARRPARKPDLPSRARAVAAQLAIILALAAGYLAIVRDQTRAKTAIMWDEFGWIAASDSTFRLMFLDTSGGAERWHEGFQATTYGAMNPNFAKLVMGLALYCWGYDLEPPAFFPRLGPGHPRFDQLTGAQRVEMGAAYVPYIIRMRWLMLYIGMACAVALFFVGRAISGPVLGVAAYVAFIFTPLVKTMSFVVYSDNVLLLTSLLSILATVRVARWWADPSSARSIWRAFGGLLLIAVLYGITVATKFNGALVCIAGALAVVILWISGRFRHHRAWTTPVALVGVAAVAFSVFVLLNPQFYEDIPGRIAWSVEQWHKLIATQQRQFQGTYTINTLGGQIAAVYRHGLLGAGPWAHFLPIGAAILTGLGFVLIGRRWILGLRGRGDLVGPAFLVAWTVVVVVATTLWLPLNWPRYYLPLIPALCLLQAVPIEAAWRACERFRHRDRSRKAAT